MSHPQVVSAINGIGVVLEKLMDRVEQSEKALVAVQSASKKRLNMRKKQAVPLVVRVRLNLMVSNSDQQKFIV